LLHQANVVGLLTKNVLAAASFVPPTLSIVSRALALDISIPQPSHGTLRRNTVGQDTMLLTRPRIWTATAAALLLCGLASRPTTPAYFAAPVCDDAAVVDTKQTGQLRGLLAPLVATPFFATFHVALDAPCPFWTDDNGKCAMRECSVCNCPEDEVPLAWRAADIVADATLTRKMDAKAPEISRASPFESEQHARAGETATAIATTSKTGSRNDHQCASGVKGDALNDVDRSQDDQSGSLQTDWAAPSTPTDWTAQNVHSSEMIYVDLRKNPERYTGFSGPETHRIWSAVYDENCFEYSNSCKSGICAPGTCKEERVLFRLISGIHTSISMHIAHDFLHGTRWGTNLKIFKSRIRAFPERITNLHVTLAVVMRAVAKVAPSLDPAKYDYSTGDKSIDDITTRDVRYLLAHPLLARGCEDRVFDESDMFLENPKERLPEFRAAFRNISMIMDCVGCEKCRLWGKLQFLGLGTALSILFTEDPEPILKRNDAIALFNLLFKLLSSVEWIEEMNRELEQRASLYAMLGKVVAGCVLFLVALVASSSTTNSAPKSIGKRRANQRVSEVDINPVEISSNARDNSADSLSKGTEGAIIRRRGNMTT
jgi:ERO1-like protein alpha